MSVQVTRVEQWIRVTFESAGRPMGFFVPLDEAEELLRQLQIELDNDAMADALGGE